MSLTTLMGEYETLVGLSSYGCDIALLVLVVTKLPRNIDKSLAVVKGAFFSVAPLLPKSTKSTFKIHIKLGFFTFQNDRSIKREGFIKTRQMLHTYIYMYVRVSE